MARDVDLNVAPLTVLTGLNGSGKSTIIQSLALLKQSMHWGGGGLRLRGALVQLGYFTDVYSESAETEGIRIELVESGQAFSWTAIGSARSDFLPFTESPAELPEFLRTDRVFQLLPADRIVPRVLFDKAVDSNEGLGFLGCHGECVVDFLLRDRDMRERLEVSEVRSFPLAGHGITPNLLAKVAPTRNLLDQVSGWLQQLSPGVRIDVDEIINADDVLLQFGYVGRAGVNESSRSFRPTNVGFGLTYCLPVVVACLAAERGALLLLENPEAHLHPQGQAAMGRLIAQAAGDGVQVLIETHSDHVLNGIRVAVKEGVIEGGDVAVHYFTRDVSLGVATVQSPPMSNSGKLTFWPNGFFDQIEKDLAML